jgi:hypothetical protein
MKKILLSLIVLLFIAFSSNGQEKKMSIGLGFGGGYVTSKQADGEKNSGFGMDFYVNYLYNINYNISVGVEYNALLGLLGSVNAQSGQISDAIEVFDMNKFVAKGVYTFGKDRRNNKGPRFFAGLGLGMYGIKPQFKFTKDDGDFELSLDRKYSFGITPEIGVIFGVFLLTLTYDLPGKYKNNDIETKYSAIMFNVGWNIGIGKN